MKNIKIVLSVLIIALFSSCQDAIDIVQPGELPSAKTFTSVDDLKKGVLGVYPQMTIMPDISFNSIFPDEVKLGFANGGQGLNDGSYGFILNANSGDANAIWFGNYGCINAANRVIAGAEKLKLTAATTDTVTINDNIAQVKVMRAFAHFRLLSYFSEDVADDSKLGVILLDHVPTQTEYLPRSTNGVVFDFINKDLDFAQANLSTNIANSDNTYISIDFIAALRARMAAYRNKYADAGKYADQLINGDASGVNSYTLTGQSGYAGIWSDTKPAKGTKDEVIFKLAHIKNDPQIGAIWASGDSSITGSPFYTMSTDLYNLLNNPGDIRFNSFVGGDSDANYNSGGKGKIIILKYPGKGTGTDRLALLNDEKVFRLSEMYFIKAESQAGTGDYAGAQASLQAISDARFGVADGGIAPSIPTLTASTVWAEILKQRRIELCYEGHRYLDLKRLGAKAGVNVERNSKDCFINGACFLSTSDYRFTLPIPNAEIAANKMIKSQQNPGY